MADSFPAIRLGFALPHLHTGGIERVVVNLLGGLDRARFRSTLFLKRAEGQLLAAVPEDVEIVALGGRRAALLPVVLTRELQRRRIEVLYSGTNAMNLSALAAGRLMPTHRRPRFVITEHTSAAEYLAEFKAPTIRRMLLRLLYPRADLLVAPLEEVAAGWTEALGIAGLETAALPNPVIDGRRLPPLPGPRSDGTLHMVAAGRLVEAKGFDVLLRAFARIAGDLTETRLTIYGEGPERSKLAARIAAAGLAHRVHLAGNVPDLVAAFSHADLFVLSSRREGFGNVVVEAMAAGVPVIASDCTGPRRILHDGAFGVIVPPGDVDALASALRAFVEDPTPFLRRRSVARERAMDFTLEAATRSFEDLVAGLVPPAQARWPASQ